MDLSVIIPVKDDVRIRRCIDSIDEDVETVIVLNTPSNEVRGIIEEYDLSVIEIDTNNLAKAYNEGIKASKSDNLLFMDSDCVFDPGTIQKLYDGLKESSLSKGKVVFNSESLLGKIVALSREYHITDIINAYSPPLAFKKSIKESIGGHYYNEAIYWTEDHEFDQRVQKSGLHLHYDPTSVIWHDELSIKADMRSAFMYGGGYYEGIRNGFTEPGFLYGGNRSLVKSVCLDLARLASLPAFVIDVSKKKGAMTGLYMVAWMGTFALGYYSQAAFNFLEVKKNEDSCFCTTL